MRIFDPKDQLGNSLLSQADTQKSSVKLEKQMAVGGGAITLTSTDISDIENWELSNARVKVNGQMISFLPDTVRNSDGSLTVDFGAYFPNAALILKRTVFDGMKQEEEEITIDVEIRQLMEKTLAAAGKPDYDAEENIKEWQELGVRAKETGEEKYRYADVQEWSDDIQLGSVVTEPFLSLRSLQFVSIQSEVTEWRSDLPALEITHCVYFSGPLDIFDAKMPNLKNGSCMFQDKESLRSFNSEMPSLTEAEAMFEGCTGLNSFSAALPNSITYAPSMFNGCTNLTSFQSDMPSDLTNADSMFKGCKLDKESVEKIADTIPDVGGTSGVHDITIGYDGTKITDAEATAFENTIAGKGWTVTMQKK